MKSPHHHFHDISTSTAKDLHPLISTAIHPATVSLDHALIQAADLPFYDDFKLYEVTDLRLGAGTTYKLLMGPNDAYLLDGSSEAIYEVNRKAPLRLDPSCIVSYLRFFLTHTDSPRGAFTIVETPSDIPWLPEASEKEIAEAAESIQPMTVEKHDAAPLFALSGTVLFRKDLFSTNIVVALAPAEVADPESGETEQLEPGEFRMLDPKVLLPDLPVHAEYEMNPEKMDGDFIDEEDADEGQHGQSAFEPYEALPRIDGIDFQEPGDDIFPRILAAIPSECRPAEFSEDNSRVHIADLPFYSEFKLCAVTCPDGDASKVYFSLYQEGTPGIVVPIDKTNAPIYGVNDRGYLLLSPETLPAYAEFFFFLVRGVLGRFIIAEKPVDIAWLPNASEKEKTKVNKHLIPVTYQGIDADGLHSLRASVVFKNALFHTDIKVAPKEMEVFDKELDVNEHFTIGQMKLANEEVIVEDLNVVLD